MSLKKLAVAASGPALLAGAASAQTLTFQTAGTIDVAEELSFANGAVNGNLPALSVMTAADLPINNGFLITVDITGSGAFATSGGGAVVAGDLTSTPTTATMNAITSNVTATSASFLFDVVAATMELNFADLPLIVTGCESDVTLSVSLSDPNGNPIEGGMASLTDTPVAPAMAVAVNDLVECVDTYQVSIASDVAAAPAAGMVGGGIGGQDSVLSLASNFQAFLAAGADVAGTAQISVLQLIVAAGVMGPLFTDTADAADITDIEFDVVFDDLTGLGDIESLAPNATMATIAMGTTTAAFDLNTPAVGNTILTVDTAAMAADIQPQQPVVQDAVLDLGTGFVDQDVLVVGFGADDLNLQGASFGPFDWVTDSTSSVNTVFRGTGFDPADVPDAVVTVSNSSLDNGGDINGVYDLDLTGLISSGGQIVLNSASLQAAVGQPFGIADITVTVFASGNFDIDRLYAAGGVISSFGDTGNSGATPTTPVSD